MKITFPPLDDEQTEDETLELPYKIRGVEHRFTLWPAAASSVPAIDALFQYFSIPALKQAVDLADYPSKAERKKALVELAKASAKREAKLGEFGVNLDNAADIWNALLGSAHQEMVDAGASAAQIRRASMVALVWHATGSVESAMGVWSGKARSETPSADGSTPSDRTGDEESEAPLESGVTTSTPTTTS